MNIWKDVLANIEVGRSPSSPTILELEVIIHQNPTQNRFYHASSKEPTWAGLASIAKVHGSGAERYVAG